MKDYYKSNEDFILGYKIRKKDIKVKFSNGKKIKVAKENKENIDLIMKKQIEHLSINELEKEENKLIKWIVFFGFCTILCVLAALACSFKSMVYCLISSGFSIVSGILVCNNISKSSKINDTIKNLEYIENEKKLNTEIEKTNVLNNCPRKAKKIVTKSKNKKFDINSINKLSYKQLKELLEIINKIDYLTDTNEKQEETKRLKLVNDEQKN